MEIVLNLVWLLVSLGAILFCVRSARRRGTRLSATTVTAVLLLVVLLFPAISMTDDLMATNTPALAERVLVWHEQVALTVTALACMLDAFLPASPRTGLAARSESPAEVPPRAYASVVLAGQVRALGVRGPSLPGV